MYCIYYVYTRLYTYIIYIRISGARNRRRRRLLLKRFRRGAGACSRCKGVKDAEMRVQVTRRAARGEETEVLIAVKAIHV